MRRRGRVNDDWIERGVWRRFGAPMRAVRYHPSASGILRGIVGPTRAGGYRVPLPVALWEGEGGEGGPERGIAVEVAGYRIGRLNAPADEQARSRGLMREGRATVCGLVVGGDPDHPGLEVRLWLDRRLAAGHEVALSRQREAAT